MAFPSRHTNVNYCFILNIVGDLKPERDVEFMVGFFLITPDHFRNNKRAATLRIKIYDDDRYGKYKNLDEYYDSDESSVPW